MEILATGPLRATAFVFQPAAGHFALTVVCKLTFVLEPGTCALALEHEEIHDEENYWDDDPKRSLYAPSDMAPMKRRADVLLVGSAFAPGGRAVRVLTARLAVGEVEKAVEVHGPRLFTAAGELREGAAWAKMPLRYERAAGGPDTWNPVGVWLDGPRDPYGQKHLPSLQPASVELREPDQLFAPIAFGPIASDWPSRKERIRERADITGLLSARASALGDDFDLAYFQDAPADQQLASLRPDQSILLENLHPEHPRLHTRLPGMQPRATLELSGEPPVELELVADTLWIDTDRGRCTLTFRGHRPLADAAAKGRVRIQLDEESAPVRVGLLTSAAGSGGAVQAVLGRAPVSAVAREITAVQPPTAGSTSLPFSSPAAGHTPPAGTAVGPENAPPRLKTRVSGEAPDGGAASPPLALSRAPRAGARQMTQEIVVDPATMAGLAGPAWLLTPDKPAAPGAAPPPPEPPSFEGMPRAPLSAPPSFEGMPRAPLSTPPSFEGMPRAPLAAPPSFEGMPRAPLTTPPSLLAVPPAGLDLPPPPSLLTASPAGLDLPAPPRSPLPASPRSAGSSATTGGVLAASNAAAGATREPPPREVAATVAAATETRAESQAHVELMWFDRAVIPRLRSHEVFGGWMKPAPKAAPTQQGKPPPPPPSAEAVEKAERADVHAILSHEAAPASESRSGGDDADPPLVLVHGMLSFPFEPVEVLKAVMTVARPLAAADKKLKEALDLAAEVLKSELDAADALDGLTARIREAWGRVNRSHPATHLDARVEQMLLEQRKYQKRTLLDGEWIRALIAASPGESLVVYLPAKVEKRLPLFGRFQARLLTRLHPPQDATEVAPVALEVVALGRAVTRPKLGK